jgi:serine/threonine-protein kinase
VKLADFGIAKAAEDSRITQIGSVLGTAAYLSPERAKGQEATVSSDVYSIGVVLYQSLAGRVPYESGSLTELALRQQEGDPEPLALVNPSVGPELSRAVARSLVADPAERYRSARDMRVAIEEALRGRDSAATIALEQASAERRDATAVTQLATPGPAAESTSRTRVLPRAEPAPRRRQRVVRDERQPRPIKPRRRRGRFTRLMAMMFLFLLIATVVAAIVILNLDTTDSRHFEHVVQDRVQDQINGIRDLIDSATK